MKIAAVVITYNRCDLLARCLKALDDQTVKPDIIYVVDNASTDDTPDFLASKPTNIPLEIVSLPENTGGAGGFYTGLKTAYETGRYDYFWLMDDDGVPAPQCLENLLKLVPMDYIAPLVLDIDSPKDLAFLYLGPKNLDEVYEQFGEHGIITGYSSPFNGILISRHLVKDIGYPRKEYFIWGDETDYSLRAANAHKDAVTAVDAHHYHPKDRTIYYPDYRRHKVLIYVDSKLRRYCYYRNYTNILKGQGYRKKLARIAFSYTLFYLFNRRLDFKGLALYWRAFRHGWKGDFSHTKEYIGK